MDAKGEARHCLGLSLNYYPARQRRRRPRGLIKSKHDLVFAARERNGIVGEFEQAEPHWF